MPGFDGTGPLGRGPMTGQGRGFCILRSSENSPGQLQGFAGLQGMPVSQTGENFEKSTKEVTNMPFGDRTGPMGFGPMTGRAAGFCAGYPVPGYINPTGGRGFIGRGRGFWGRGGGRGWRNWFYATGLPGWARAGYGRPTWSSVPFGPEAPMVTAEQELDSLKQQAEYFQNALDGISKRIEGLEKAEPEK